MIVTVRTWYGERSLRERRMLLAMAAIGLPLLLWLALILPVERAYRSALERQLEAVDRHARIASLAERTKAKRATVPPPRADLPLYLADSARQSGLTAVPSGAPVAGAASVTIAAADASAALAWLSGLEARGYAVSDVRIAAGADRQVAVTATVGVRR